MGLPKHPPTKEQADAMVDSLRKNNFRETAIASAGVNPWIARTWIRQGVQDRDNNIESVYSDLINRMTEAEAAAEAELIGGIREAGFKPFVKSESDKGMTYERGSWQALAWIAERRGSKNWGVKKTLDVNIDRDRVNLLEVAEKVLDSAQFDKLLGALAATYETGEDSSSDSSREARESEDND